MAKKKIAIISLVCTMAAVIMRLGYSLSEYKNGAERGFDPQGTYQTSDEKLASFLSVRDGKKTFTLTYKSCRMISGTYSATDSPNVYVLHVNKSLAADPDTDTPADENLSKYYSELSGKRLDRQYLIIGKNTAVITVNNGDPVDLVLQDRDGTVMGLSTVKHKAD